MKFGFVYGDRYVRVQGQGPTATTCLQSRGPEVNLFRSRNPSRHTESCRARPTVVHHRLYPDRADGVLLLDELAMMLYDAMDSRAG